MEPGLENDEQLLIEAAQRDPRHFLELYERNFARVYAYMTRRAGNREEAQDLTAEVFHQALANLARFDWRGVPFAACLYKIAANAIADRWKSAARERGNPSASARQEVPAAGEFDFEQIEQRARLFDLVNGLPGDQRRVIEMRFAEQKSIREIAQALQRTEGSVKQLQFRALQALRARAGKTGPTRNPAGNSAGNPASKKSRSSLGSKNG
jgi:RNA polymerase sigma-70 factor (ECF subfamily)